MFLSLGPTALANSFLSNGDEFEREEKYPLDVYFCEECSLVQLLDVIDPEILFRDYIYVTGTSSTIVSHNKEYAASISDILDLQPGQKVAEVASNNGQLLSCFADLGFEVLGIEPAINIAKMANDAGINTICEFFDQETAGRVRHEHGTFRTIIGNNVLAHVDDPQGFLKACKSMIDDDGLVVFEVPYLGEFLKELEYDTVYHEHLCYFSVSALVRLCEAAGLRIERIVNTTVHGGSLRVHAAKSEHISSHSEGVLEIVKREESNGIHDFATYERFAKKVMKNRADILNLLKSIKSDGGTIAAYGAAAKGNTFLNFCGIDTELVDFVVDRNPLKVGKYTPGAHLPVYDVSEIAIRKPDYLLILAWNFAGEIMGQQQYYKRNGGKFVIALPEPRIE